MRCILLPRLRVRSVMELTPQVLRARGIRLLLLDLDNTLAPYSGAEPSQALCAWRDALRAAGITPFIVSNTKTERARRFAQKWNVEYIDRAGKPRRAGVLRAVALAGCRVEETALAGDQLFTDVLGANLAGVLSVATRPLELKNPLYALRYAVELPFRCLRKRLEESL